MFQFSKFTYALITAVAGATACVTPYQHMGFSGGYEEEDLGDGTFLVIVKTNGYTDATTTFRYFHRRAGEVCRARGFASYTVLDSDKATERKKQTDGMTITKSAISGRVRCMQTAPT